MKPERLGETQKRARCRARTVRSGAQSRRSKGARPENNFRAQTINYLVPFLDLQLILHFLHSAYLHSELFSPIFLFGRFDHAAQGNHAVGRIHVDAGKIGGFLANQLRLYLAGNRRVVDYWPAVCPVIEVQPRLTARVPTPQK
jgi:hypothetical protein